MSAEGGYALAPRQVPVPPQSVLWIDQLRWCVAVMDADDDALGFAASLLAYASDRSRLTERQQKAALRVVNRVRCEWQAGMLDCQQERQLSVVETEVGGAA